MYARIVPYNNTTIETRKKKEIKDKASRHCFILLLCPRSYYRYYKTGTVSIYNTIGLERKR